MEWSGKGAADAASDGGDFGDHLPDDVSDAGLELLTATACPDAVNAWLEEQFPDFPCPNLVN